MMKKVFKNPHYIFWLAIPFLILIGILNKERSIDINIYDTYYIIDFTFLSSLLSLIFLVIGLGYWSMKKANRKLSRRLNIIHIILTFGGIFLIWSLSQFYRNGWQEFGFNANLTFAIYIIALAIIIGQLLFPLNILWGLLHHSKNASEKH